jgi:SAM-dependent methyltransferase
MLKLDMLTSDQEEMELLEASVRGLFDGRSELRILEAGCGPSWPLRLPDIKYKLTGVDLDPAALERRKTVAKDLDEALVADLREIDFGGRTFDVIYNAFVLEHIENAALVLENFSRWLKPGGLLILLLPDRDTVFGFLTRMTPLWFHVLYHKYILGRKNAGRPGFGPYPTHYDPIVSRKGIREFCKTHRFRVREERGLCTYRIQNSARARLVRVGALTVSVLSLGRLPWTHNNLTYVLCKE